MPQKAWENYLDSDTRIRARIRSDGRGRIVAFTAQLEVLVGGEWHPAVRYDNAHGRAHIDYINPKGVTYEKVWLDHWEPYNEAFTLADNELKTTYHVHRARFLNQLRGS